MSSCILVLAVAATALAAPPAAAGGEGAKVREVRIAGQTRIDRDTILFHVALKPGEAYDASRASADFRKLWDTGLFDDLRLEVEEAEGARGEPAVDLVWHVVERPVLAAVRFEGNEGISEEDIKTHLKEKGIELENDRPYGQGQLERARRLIEDLHRDRGYRFASVALERSADAAAGDTVVFRVDEGSKVKIAEIDFEGNRAFDDGDLRGVFKKTKAGGMFCFISKHCIFKDSNFQEDLERLREHYMNRGFINFAVGEPAIEARETSDGRQLSIRVPVSEGIQYRTGEVKVEGNTAYPADTLLALNRVERGEPVSRKKIVESKKDMEELYGVKGYFNIVIAPHFDESNAKSGDGAAKSGDAPARDTDRTSGDAVDVVYRITETDRYYLHRLGFRGNTSTKDKVIRRQMRLAEGDLFNTALFKRSLLLVQQLGYFSEPQPRIEPSPEDPTKLDVTLDLQEQGRNDIRFGGGYSGVEGLFGTFAFSTRNLFGSGNSLTVDVQGGANVEQYRLAYLDPYILDKPISGGIDLFDRYVDYVDFEREGTGGILQLGVPFADFWFLRNSYRYEDVETRPSVRHDADGNEIPPTPLEVALYTDQRRVSAIEPVLVYSTIDNPIRPWRGFRQLASVEVAGGILGGTANQLKPRLDTTFYLPLHRRVGFGFHAEAAYVTGFGEGEASEVPLFEKFYLGGERSLRGYPPFEVGPRDERGVVVGGDKMIQFNAELNFRIAEPVQFVIFGDAGNSYAKDDEISFSNLEASVGAEVRFWTPFLQAPLRLIWSYIPDPLVRRDALGNEVEDPKTDFTFSIGTTF